MKIFGLYLETMGLYRPINQEVDNIIYSTVGRMKLSVQMHKNRDDLIRHLCKLKGKIMVKGSGSGERVE